MTKEALSHVVAALGDGPLTEASLARHVFPLFSKVLNSDQIYLANHSLGRPLDQTGCDVTEAVHLWQTKLGDAWDDWLAERKAFRSRIAQLIGSPRADCIVPKSSAGQGLRTVLNALPGIPRIISTRGEFDSIDLILKHYTTRGRITIEWIEPRQDGYFDIEEIVNAARAGVDLVVISHVMFATGQVIEALGELARTCHARGARLLVDAYHSIGVFPVNVISLGTDFLVGGSYKYLRGGPGAAFLYISAEMLDSGLVPLDMGWFAKRDPFLYERPDPPQFAPGGDAFLEGTPPVLAYYQARSGQQFTLELGVGRLREYNLDRLARLKHYLADCGIESAGGDEDHGAFLTVRHPDAAGIAKSLAAAGVHTDARGPWLRLCPDCLTRDEELIHASKALAQAINSRPP